MNGRVELDIRVGRLLCGTVIATETAIAVAIAAITALSGKEYASVFGRTVVVEIAVVVVEVAVVVVSVIGAVVVVVGPYWRCFKVFCFTDVNVALNGRLLVLLKNVFTVLSPTFLAFPIIISDISSEFLSISGRRRFKLFRK